MNIWGAIISQRAQDNWAPISTLLERIRAAGLNAAGFVQRQCPDTGNYELVSVVDGESVPLACRNEMTGDPALRLCDFQFFGEAFDAGFRWVERGIQANAEIVILDQVGKLELARSGHFRTLQSLESANSLCLLGIRTHKLVDVVNRFVPNSDPITYLEIPADDSQEDIFINQLATWCKKRRSGLDLPPRGTV